MSKKIKQLLTFLSFLFLGISSSIAQKSDTGFFLIIENQANCRHLVHALIDVTPYCLPEDPVIAKSEFEFINELKFNKVTDAQYIDLKLTPEGFEILQTLATRLPNTRLALVVEDNVVGIFQGIGSIDNPIIPIHGRANSAEINWLYDKVKKGIH